MTLRAPVSTDDNVPVINGHWDSHASGNILPICTELAAHVKEFLESEQETKLLKNVQEQTRVALGVIDEALERYRFVNFCPVNPEEG
jgi:FAD synthetase